MVYHKPTIWDWLKALPAMLIVAFFFGLVLFMGW